MDSCQVVLQELRAWRDRLREGHADRSLGHIRLAVLTEVQRIVALGEKATDCQQQIEDLEAQRDAAVAGEQASDAFVADLRDLLGLQPGQNLLDALEQRAGAAR